MGSEYGSPVLFTKEKNVWQLSCRFVIGANGQPVLDTNNSKGFCAVWQNTPTFNAGTTGSSNSIGTVSSFVGLFSGMNLTVSTSAAFIGTATIGSFTAITDSFKVTAVNNGQSGFPQASVPLLQFVAGSAGGGTGQYIIQLGQQAAIRTSTYVKLLGIQHSFDMTTASAVGTAVQSQLVPVAPAMVLIGDNTKIKTIPQSATSGSSDGTVTVQFGYYNSGGTFQAQAPAPGEAVRVVFMFGNCTAP